MNIFRAFVDRINERYQTYEAYVNESQQIRNDLYHQIAILFH